MTDQIIILKYFLRFDQFPHCEFSLDVAENNQKASYAVSVNHNEELKQPWGILTLVTIRKGKYLSPLSVFYVRNTLDKISI